MKNTDPNMNDFFLGMKKEDDNVLIPDFEEVTKKSRPGRSKFLIPIGIAASILILLSLYFGMPSNSYEPDNSELTITISVAEQLNTNVLLKIETDIDSWVAPSAFLIDDFNGW